MKFAVRIILLLSLLHLAVGWDLTNLGINEDHYISNIAVYLNRAFLAIPRSICFNNVSDPTLVEVPWPEFNAPLLPLRNKLLEHQEWHDCTHLQDAIALGIEPKKPKLWILDKGNEKCQPKVTSYDLFKNVYSQNIKFGMVLGEHLNEMVIDPYIGESGPRAYLGITDTSEILIVLLNQLKQWKIHLKTSDNVPPINPVFLAVSKTKPILYITGRLDEAVFSVDLKGIRDSEEGDSEVNATFLGNKLGISNGLEIDLKNGLIYYLIRDLAVVRWITEKPLKAEYHNVLSQSYEKIPYVTQIFTGPRNGIWALVNTLEPNYCRNTVDDTDYPEKRTVKILKYNRFFDNF